MSTKSRIIIRNGDESLLVIYGHRDVYPSYDGAVLHIHCQSRKMIWELIAPGNISLEQNPLSRRKENIPLNRRWKVLS